MTVRSFITVGTSLIIISLHCFAHGEDQYIHLKLKPGADIGSVPYGENASPLFTCLSRDELKEFQKPGLPDLTRWYRVGLPQDLVIEGVSTSRAPTYSDDVFFAIIIR